MSTSATTSGEANKKPAPKENEKLKAAVDWDDEGDDDEEEQEIGVNYGIKPKVTPAPSLNIIKASTQQAQALGQTSTAPATTSTKQDQSKQWEQESQEKPIIEEDANEETKSKPAQEERWGKAQDNESPSDAANQSNSWGNGERRDNYNKGGKRYQNPRPERPPVQEIDPNTNFRKYYEKDNSFYLKVLDAEEPGVEGHEFKLQLFKGDDYVENVGESLIAFGSSGFEQDIMVRLMDYDAEHPRSQTHRIGEQFDKHRIMFRIKNKEKAIQFWQDFVMNKNKRIHEGCRHKVYLQKPEEVFVKYGDIEAEKYYQELEEKKRLWEEEQAAQLAVDKKSQGARQFDQKGEGKRPYKRNEEGGEAEGERHFKGKDRRGDKHHYKNNQDNQEEDQKLFEELKHGKSTGENSKPTFKNSGKQYNKEEPVNPTVTEEQVQSPIVMPSEPHRKVIDNSRPKRTVTENKPALTKTRSQQYQAKTPIAVGDVTPSDETTSYGVEHIHDGQFKSFAGAVIQEENEQEQQQQQAYYPKKGRNDGGQNRQGGGGRGRGSRQGGNQYDQGHQGEGYQGQERPARGGYSKNHHKGDNQDYNQEDYGQQEYADQGYKAGQYKPKQQNQIQNEPRKEGYRPKTAGGPGQGGEGRHQGQNPSKKTYEERKGGEGGEYQPKKHGAVLGPKAGANTQKGTAAPTQQNQGKKTSQNLFAFFEK